MIIRKNTAKFIGSWLLAIAAAFGSYKYMNNDYMTDRKVFVTVVDKLQTNGSKGSVHLSVIYKTDDGIVFDEYVSPSTYTTSYVGDRYAINIRPFDIRQTPSQNLWFFFLPVLAASCSTTFIIMLLIFGWGMLARPEIIKDTKVRYGGGMIE